MNRFNNTYSVQYCCQVISRYIYEKKGVAVNINPNLRDPKEVKLFEKATTIAMGYYNL